MESEIVGSVMIAAMFVTVIVLSVLTFQAMNKEK